MESEADGGFLKLTTTRDWIAGDSSAPLNRKLAAEVWVYMDTPYDNTMY